MYRCGDKANKNMIFGYEKKVFMLLYTRSSKKLRFAIVRKNDRYGSMKGVHFIPERSNGKVSIIYFYSIFFFKKLYHPSFLVIQKKI
jgi:hypothetical protein